MGNPHFQDQVRKAPTQALRAMFAGIGKVLLAADRPQAGPRAAGPKHAAPGRRPARAEGSGAAPSQRWRSLDETGNVRLLSGDELAAGQPAVLAVGPEGAAASGSELTGSELTGRGSAPVPAPRLTITPATPQPLWGNVPVGSSLVVHELPLPGYDTMSVATIRARLRSLDVGRLQALLVHEQKNAERPEIIAMIERRIEKLESGG